MSPYARREAAWITLLGAAVTAAVAYWAGWWAILPALIALALLAFYRDPPRRCPDRADALLAPADGKVTDIKTEETAGGRLLRIGIFLSVFDVHMNRSPCAGRVAEVLYREGKFWNALREQSTEENESNTVRIEPSPPLPGPVCVRQIAGVLARRIVCVVRAGDRLTAGERFGMIKLGSRTELTAPDDGGWQVHVKVGDTVRAGLSLLLSRRNAG